jgi:pyrroline-5-carboxylate reductase
MKQYITFLGGGNMASAITAGLLAQGHPSTHLHIVQRNLEKAQVLQQLYPVRVDQDYQSAIASADVVICAVKPQSFPELLQTVSGPLLERKPIVVSIMSGLRLSRLESALPGLTVVRVMPNTPARVQAGVSLITPANPIVESIFKAVGEVVLTPSERVFEQLTALTGCGPAFVYYLVEQLAKAMHSIAPQADCLPLARATFEGALALMKSDTAIAPETLIAQVAPKGGMTAESMKILKAGLLQELFEKTLEAAIKRGDELAL